MNRRGNYVFYPRTSRPPAFLRIRETRRSCWRSILNFFLCRCRKKRHQEQDREDHRIFERDVQTDIMEPVPPAALPHRPHTPSSRKRSPEILAAVRSALNQLEGTKDVKPVDSGDEGRPRVIESKPG